MALSPNIPHDTQSVRDAIDHHVRQMSAVDRGLASVDWTSHGEGRRLPHVDRRGFHVREIGERGEVLSDVTYADADALVFWFVKTIAKQQAELMADARGHHGADGVTFAQRHMAALLEATEPGWSERVRPRPISW